MINDTSFKPFLSLNHCWDDIHAEMTSMLRWLRWLRWLRHILTHPDTSWHILTTNEKMSALLAILPLLVLPKRFPLGTEWDIHDFHAEMTSMLRWHPCWDDIHAEMTSILRWHPCWDDIQAEMTSMLRWHPYWDDIHAEMTSLLRWHSCWDDIHAEMTSMLRWHPCWDDIHAEMTEMTEIAETHPDTSWHMISEKIV